MAECLKSDRSENNQHNTGEKKHNNEDQKHNNEELKHNNDEQKHSKEEGKHSNEDQKHSIKDQKPNNEDQKPNNEDQKPNNEDQKPNNEDQKHNKNKLSKKVFVGNISFRVTREQLTEFFSQYGRVEQCIIVKDHIRRRPKGIGFITFSSLEDVEKVLNLTPEELYCDNRQLRVHKAEESKRKNFTPVLRRYEPNNRTSEHTDLNNGQAEQEDQRLSECDEEHGDVREQLDESVSVELEDDILLLIFTCLPVKDRIRIERVSKHWKELARKSWVSVRHLNFCNIFRRFGGLTDKMLKSVLERGCTKLTSLDLSASPRFLTEYAVELAAHYCSHLMKIDLSGVDVTNHSLRTLSEKCSKLKNVCLEQNHFVGEKGLWWLFHQCRELESISLNGNPRVTGQCFHMCKPKLKRIKLNGCHKLLGIGITKLTEKCPDLKFLDISKCPLLEDQDIKHIGQELKNLQVLHLAGCYQNLSQAGLVHLGGLPMLRELHLSMNMAVSDEVLQAVAEGCSCLECLDISSCHQNITNRGVKYLAMCDQLTKLNISYLPMVDDDTLEMIAVNGKLETLIARACSGLSDQGLTKLAEFCIELRELDVSGCLPITNATWRTFAELRSNPGVTRAAMVLNVGGTSITTDDIEIPAGIELRLHDLSYYHLRPDRELLFNSGWEEEDGDDGEEHIYGKAPLEGRHGEPPQKGSNAEASQKGSDPEAPQEGIISELSKLRDHLPQDTETGGEFTISEDDAEAFLDADDPMLETEFELS